MTNASRTGAAERGQALVLTLLFMTVLVGMAAAVLDVGSWYRADRQLQATADSAALAGAQELPESPSAARAAALDYADRNGGGLDGSQIEITTKVIPNDTIRVSPSKPAPGFFSKLFGLRSVQVGAKAAARASNPSKAKWVAPITVSEKHPKLICKPRPCFGEETAIELDLRHKPGSGDAAGAFGLLDLREGGAGSAGSSEVSDWMASGFDQYMKLGTYYSVPSTMFNSSEFRSALRLRTNDEVLFPIYRPPIKAGGSNAMYDIIGWVGFYITDWTVDGSFGKVFGHFTRVIWEGVESDRSDAPDFGVRVLGLVE